MKQPLLSQRRLLTQHGRVCRDHVSKADICAACDAVINSLLREVIWCIWVCAAGE